MVRQALEAGTYTPLVGLRINAVSTGLAELDLDQTFTPQVGAICLPKAEKPTDVETAASHLAALEAEHGLASGSVGLLPTVETALGVLNAYEIARSSARVLALCLGGEDLTRDLGATRTRQGAELSYARSYVVVAARAAGVLAIDTVYTDYSDQDGLEAEATLVRQMGYSGKLLIHPGQIDVVRRAFAPSETEVAYARRLVEGFEEAQARGEGVFTLDGEMVDAPVVARARQVLANVN
jgi:citrate lyase subunit beta/citryl-CoA lyase